MIDQTFRVLQMNARSFSARDSRTAPWLGRHDETGVGTGNRCSGGGTGGRLVRQSLAYDHATIERGAAREQEPFPVKLWPPFKVGDLGQVPAGCDHSGMNL